MPRGRPFSTGALSTCRLDGVVSSRGGLLRVMEGCCTEHGVLSMSCGFCVESERRGGRSVVHGDARYPGGLGWRIDAIAVSFGSGVQYTRLSVTK